MVISVYDLSIKDLYYVLALAEHKHFGRAAEAALVSQPALTKQIKNIEETLGVLIFERNKRNVNLTTIGYQIVEQARSVIDETQKLIGIASSKSEILTGQFRLGAIHTSGPYLIPRFLPSLIKSYPKLELIVKEGYTNDLFEDLKTGKLDAVIASTPFEEPSLSYQNLFFEEFKLAVNKDHKLAQRKQVSPENIDTKDLLLLQEGNCLSDQAWAMCPTRQRGETFQYQASSIDTLHYMIAYKLGYSIIPVLAKTKDPNITKHIKYIDFKKRDLGREIVLVYRKNYANTQNVNTLVSLVKSLRI